MLRCCAIFARTRLVAGGAEQRLFEYMLLLFKEQGLVKGKGRQRTDATHVLAAIHVLNRLECIGETLRHVLNTLATTAPAWLQSWVPAAWYPRYGRRIEEYRLPDAKADRYALAEAWGADGRDLLTRLWEPATDPALRDPPAVQTLRLVWVQQFHAVPPEVPMHWREATDLPPAPDLICTPYDVEARFSKKRETRWVGYKVHLTETMRRVTHHTISAAGGIDLKEGQWVAQPTGCGNTHGNAACWESRGYPEAWRIGRLARPAPYGKSWIA